MIIWMLIPIMLTVASMMIRKESNNDTIEERINEKWLGI